MPLPLSPTSPMSPTSPRSYRSPRAVASPKSLRQSNRLDSTRFADKVAGYRASQAKSEREYGRYGPIGSNFDKYMRRRDPFSNVAAGCLLLSAILMITAISTQKIFVWTGASHTSVEIGMWQWSASFTSTSNSQDFTGDTCNDPGWVAIAYGTRPPLTDTFKSTECYETLVERCRVVKAFSIISVLTSLAGFVMFLSSHTMALVCTGLSAFAAVFYVICFSVYTGIYIGDKVDSTDADRDRASCGTEWNSSDDFTLGFGYALVVVNAFLALAAVVCSMLTKDQSNMVTPII